MKLRDITDALAADDRETMRQGFRALVDPHATVEASSPGMLVVAFNHLCVAVKDDQAEMPPATCGALAGSRCADRVCDISIATPQATDW